MAFGASRRNATLSIDCREQFTSTCGLQQYSLLLYGADDTSNEMLVSTSTDGSTWQGPAAYLDLKMGSAGPRAELSANGVYVGFPDSRYHKRNVRNTQRYSSERLHWMAELYNSRMTDLNRRWLLKSRPSGNIQLNNFHLVYETVPEPGKGDVVVRVALLSCDPHATYLAFT